MNKMKPLVGVVCGSKSDFTSLTETLKTLDQLKIPYTLDVCSAHRMPEDMTKYAKEAESKGYHAIIAVAGGAVDLSGMIAAYTIIPVIGLPVKTADLNGIDSLYSIVQMPNGIPVGAMGINRGKNAALYAAEIIALSDKSVRKRLRTYRQQMTSATRNDAKNEISKIKKSKRHPFLLQKD
jgi:5-(carboxyamino)imidazole ribonucleotide mutase